MGQQLSSSSQKQKNRRRYCVGGYIENFEIIVFSSGGGSRSRDLRIMNPTL